MKATRFFDEVMAEHIRMPGFPQLIVTRSWAYQTLRGLGWSESERGFGSLDYAIFAKQAVAEPLTPDADREYWWGQVAEEFRRACH